MFMQAESADGSTGPPSITSSLGQVLGQCRPHVQERDICRSVQDLDLEIPLGGGVTHILLHAYDD